MATFAPHVVSLSLLLASAAALGVNLRKELDNEDFDVGVMNKFGVTRYSSMRVKKARSTNGHYWPSPTSRDGANFTGATDLAEDVIWAWRHPNGIYNTIPVGAPLIDDEMKIYLASDDAIRKFDIDGGLAWTYAPRGQLAAAPALTGTGARRVMAASTDSEVEDMLRPNADDKEKHAVEFFKEIKIGDHVEVRPGMGHHSGGKEFYRAGDYGRVADIISDDAFESKAVIQWPRTGHQSEVELSSLGKRFLRVPEASKASSASQAVSRMLLGTTTNGYVFAVDLDSGEELWATQASDQISGVKGSIATKDGIVVAATNRCVDRYCYRYRNQTNPLSPSNTFVRGLSVETGSSVWQFRPDSPVWNFLPQFGRDDSLYFSDFEGTVYCLNFQTGALKWKVAGAMGTYTQAAAVYFEAPNPDDSLVIQLGVKPYAGRYCNPYPAPGILPWCSSWPGSKGFMRALSAVDGTKVWKDDMELDEPPASAAVGGLKAVGGALHTRVVVAMGFNCHANSPTQIWALDPYSGHNRWILQGPTLWTNECAGDFEGGDVRRAMGGRSVCEPNSWSLPVIDSKGDIYIGNQVGVLQRYGSPTGATRGWALLSEMTTGVAFQDQSIALANGVMAVSTCNSLIVLKTAEQSFDLGGFQVPAENPAQQQEQP